MNGYPTGSLQAAASGMLQGGGTPLSAGDYTGLLSPAKRLPGPPPRKQGRDDMAKEEYIRTQQAIAEDQLRQQAMEEQQKVGFGDVLGAASGVLGLVPGVEFLGGILGAFTDGVGSSGYNPGAGTTPLRAPSYAGLLSPGQLRR